MGFFAVSKICIKCVFLSVCCLSKLAYTSVWSVEVWINKGTGKVAKITVDNFKCQITCKKLS